ncbi:hypothetical protein HUU51_02180 [Candidatus Gracilibacteria bacterium]|nr:hypothetical protein [Candidatus Gracilibacteria bacterium]
MFGGLIRKYGISGLKRDIKKIGVSETYFIECLNLSTNDDIVDLDTVPIDKLEKISSLVKDIVFHLVALNTVVKSIGEENIGDDFDFSGANLSKKVTRIAGSNDLSSSQVREYVRDRNLYVKRLLDPRLKNKIS